MLVRQFRLDGLGHLSTLIADDATGQAAVLDPRRDVDVYLTAAREHGLQITHAVETHLHNDYVSGGRELAGATGATQVIGAGAELRHPYRPVRDAESFQVGGLRFTALDTPGHTPEHVVYAVTDTARAEEPVLMFSGGSLLVGSVGRTDLLGADGAVAAARAMFHSLHEVVLTHQDFVEVYPTHGAGSLCSTGISSTAHSTIGFERRHNPLLQPRDVETFARALLAGQPTFPPYFARMRPINQAGPRVLGGVPGPLPVSVTAASAAVGRGALLVDLVRPRRSPPATCRTRCRSPRTSRSGRGSAGSCRSRTGRSSSSSPTRPTGTTPSGRRSGSGSSRSPATSRAGSRPGRPPGCRPRPAAS